MTRRLTVLLAILSFCLLARGNETSQASQISNAKEHKLFTPFLTPPEKAYLDNSDVFTVCNVVQARRSDASLNLVKLLTRHAGIKLVASPLLSWQDALEGLKNKSCDILPWATETQARTATMNFTRPYARIVRVLVSKREQPYITDIRLFDDQIFAMEKANNITVLLKQYYPKIRTVSSNSTAQGFSLVADNKAFASIASLYSVGGLFDNGSLKELKIAGRLPSDFDDVVSLATRKDDQILYNILQRAVLTADPQLISEFMNKGAIYVFEPEVNYSKIWLIGGIVVFLFFILFWWNRNLRRLNYKLERAHTELKIKSQLLEVLSITDPLTDTYNRIKMDRVFEQEIKRSSRYKQPLSVIMIDIDYFKNVNDNHGHLVGDRVLQKFSDTIKKHIRVNDVLGRWGGEEFLVICPSTGIKEAQFTANKLRQIIESTEFELVGKMTASFGVAEWHQHESEEALLAKADHAMYLAKRQGRNQVCISPKDQF